MAEHQRKIDLQSTADLLYLQENIRVAAQQKLDIHLPPSITQGEDHTYRNKVDNLVQLYIKETLESALPSLSINGLDATHSQLKSDSGITNDVKDSNFEPYDTRLAQQLRDLYATLEDEITKVANLRREAPKNAAAAYIKTLEQEMVANDKEFDTLQATLKSVPGHHLNLAKFPRDGDVKSTWLQSKKDLEDLRNVTKVKADLERAIKAANELQQP